MKNKQLIQLEQILNSDSDFVEKINVISSTLKKLIGAERCTIFIYDEICQSFWSAHIEGLSYIELPDGKGIVSDIFHKKGIIIVNDVQNDPRFHKDIDLSTGYNTQTMLAVALLNHLKKPIGVMQLINKNRDDKKFTQQDKLILTKMVHYISQFTEHFS